MTAGAHTVVVEAGPGRLGRAPGGDERIDPGASGVPEIARLLHERLRLMVAIMLAVVAVQVVSAGSELLGGEGSFLRRLLQAGWLPFHLLHFASYLPVAWWLGRTAKEDLAALRRIELAFFGTVCAFNLYASWTVVHWVLDSGGFIGSAWRHAILPWVLIITSYGVLVPNDFRRCAKVTTSMAVFIFTLLVLALLVQRVGTAVLLRTSLNMLVPLSLAMAIAIVGAARMERLRRESQLARRLGQYQLGERLGGGGMGEVYRAEHLLMRRPCAIKLIRADRGGERMLERFEREVRATATLSHPNTVQVYDYGRSADGTFYYVMEYLPGATLEQMVEREGPLAAARAVHFLRQLCASLSEAHAIGLVHRDIKPGNVMVTRRGGIDDVIKLLDFGLVMDAAAADARLTQEGGVAATPAFASPEQAAGAANLDARSDLYSLGVLAWYLLVGHAPFDDKPSAQAMLAAHVYEMPPAPSALRAGIPAALDALVMRCLAKRPEHRPASAADVDAALAACL